MAGYGSGEFKDFTSLREKWIKTTKLIELNLKAHKEYNKYYRVYKKLYEHTKEDMHKFRGSENSTFLKVIEHILL